MGGHILWMGEGGWCCVEVYVGWVGVVGGFLWVGRGVRGGWRYILWKFLWVGGGRWRDNLDESGWVDTFHGCVGVGAGKWKYRLSGWGWVGMRGVKCRWSLVFYNPFVYCIFFYSFGCICRFNNQEFV